MSMLTIKIEDMTLDQIKAQASFYQNLYQKKRRETDPEWHEKEKERRKQAERKRREAKGVEKKSSPANKKYDFSQIMVAIPT